MVDSTSIACSPDAPADLSAAFAHCEALTRAHYENFPVGSRLIPAALRPHVCSIYAFARTADDFADEPGLSSPQRMARLREWETHLDACLTHPHGPIFTALAETLRVHNIPVQLLKDLLTAFRMDVTTRRHNTFEDLLDYCRYSANPVGRLILHLFGYADETRARQSDAICSALQLANFWQDIAIDFQRGRIYLPREDMHRFGVTEDDLAAGRITDGFCDLLDMEISRTAERFNQGRPLVSSVSGRLKLELRLTWLGGMEILRKIPKAGYDIFQRRPSIKTRDILPLFLKACLPFYWM